MCAEGRSLWRPKVDAQRHWFLLRDLGQVSPSVVCAPPTSEAVQAFLRDAHICTTECAVCLLQWFQRGAWEAAVHKHQAHSMHADVLDSCLEVLDSTEFHTVNIPLINQKKLK